MSADARIAVKISSEAAADISMTPVVAQEMTLADLVGVIVGVCGKDAARIHNLLARGSVVDGASRFRWPPVKVDEATLAALLAPFPDPDPSCRFEAARCVHARLCGAKARVELPRELAAAKRLFRRRSFWDALMECAASTQPEYAGYSYRSRAHLFRVPIAPGQFDAALPLLQYSGTAQQIRRCDPRLLELEMR